MSLETWHEHTFPPSSLGAVVAVGNSTLRESCPTESSYLLVFVQFDGNMGQALASIK